MQSGILTDMTQEDITNLIKMQLNDNASWSFETASIAVDYTYEYCYSISSQKLCVGIMNESSRQEAINKINAIMNG